MDMELIFLRNVCYFKKKKEVTVSVHSNGAASPRVPPVAVHPPSQPLAGKP